MEGLKLGAVETVLIFLDLPTLFPIYFVCFPPRKSWRIRLHLHFPLGKEGEEVTGVSPVRRLCLARVGWREDGVRSREVLSRGHSRSRWLLKGNGSSFPPVHVSGGSLRFLIPTLASPGQEQAARLDEKTKSSDLAGGRPRQRPPLPPWAHLADLRTDGCPCPCPCLLPPARLRMVNSGSPGPDAP